MASKKKNVVEKCREPERFDTNFFYGMRLDENQAYFANSIWEDDNDIVFCNAKAGTGKTTIATGVAELLVQHGKYNEIIYIVSPYGERKQGYLPGDMSQKSSVYFTPFFEALITCNVMPHAAVKDYDGIDSSKNGSAHITCMTDTFMRGVNLDDAVVIIDEAQNFTVSQLKTVLTRVKDNTKVIVIGHTLQCDLANKSLSGFDKYIKHFEGQERARICELTTNYRGWVSQHADNLEE